MTEYFVTRDDKGEAVVLTRIRNGAGGLYPELLRDGAWIEWPSVMDNLFDRNPNDTVSEQEAAKIAERLGGALGEKGNFGLADALALAERAHAGQRDKAGKPYIEHVRRVVAGVADYGAAAQMTAALHDVVEDTSWTLDGLREVGVPPEVLQAVEALTKRKDEKYEDAVRRAAAQPIARLVKLADNADNSDESRLSQLDPQQAQRLREKYARARQILDAAR